MKQESESLTIHNPQTPAVAQADNDSQLLALWLSHRSGKTRTEYARDLNWFQDWFAAYQYKIIREATAIVLNHAYGIRGVYLADLQEYAASLTDKSPNTQRRMVASVKSLFTFACKIGYLKFNVAAAIQLPHAKNVLAERILQDDN